MWKVVLLCISVTALYSCSRKENYGPGLFAIDSLMAAQAKYLADRKATLTKVTRLAGNSDKISVTPKDSIAWKKELEIFATLEHINKSVNKDLYKIESHADAKSNLTVKAFTTEEDLGVKYLRIYYQQASNKIRKIEAKYNESNALYKSERDLAMEFQQIDNKTMLTSYSINGTQKMFLGDFVQYDISGTLSLPN